MVQWFKRDNMGHILDPASYHPDSTPSCGSGTNTICAIQAENNGFDQPIIMLEAMIDEMITALHQRSHTNTNIVLRT